MANQASCAFVVYVKVRKTPVGVIKVNGNSHESPEQIRRDDAIGSVWRPAGAAFRPAGQGDLPPPAIPISWREVQGFAG
jgi:hypothetical protein